MRTILLVSPYWKEPHRWMVSSVKLAELYQRMGWRVIAVCMGRQQSTIDNQQLTIDARQPSVEVVSDTLTIHRLPDIFIPDPFNYGIAFGFTGYVRRLIRAEKPDLIVVNKVLYWTSLCVIALRLTGHKVLLLTDVLGGMTWWPRGLIARIAMVISAWTTGWLVLLSANRIVTFHPQPSRLLKFLGIAGKTEVIPTGIDEENFINSKFQNPNFKQIPKSKYQMTVTYVGRLESVKGVEVFLAAASPLLRHYPHLHVQVVGWYRDGHPLVLKYRDRVTFTGLRDDIPAILATTDIFVLPSYSEGLSNALMEAMASGCACIATEVGGNSYLIENGISGFLFPPGDVAMLQSHIRRLIEDPAKRRGLGDGARRRIEKEFSWKVIRKRYQKLFEDHTV